MDMKFIVKGSRCILMFYLNGLLVVEKILTKYPKRFGKLHFVLSTLFKYCAAHLCYLV